MRYKHIGLIGTTLFIALCLLSGLMYYFNQGIDDISFIFLSILPLLLQDTLLLINIYLYNNDETNGNDFIEILIFL